MLFLTWLSWHHIGLSAWRQTWAERSGTEPDFPVGVVQVDFWHSKIIPNKIVSIWCPVSIKLNATKFSWSSRDFIFRQVQQKMKFLHDKLFNSILQYFRNWNKIITHFVDWLTFIFFFPKMESLYVYWFHNIHDIFHNQFLDFRSCQVRGHW